MGRSLTQVAQTSSGGGLSHHPEDPYTQPCFSVWSMEYSDGGGGFFTYDHSMNMINHFRGDDNGYGSYRTHGNGASEFYDAWAGHTWNRTQSHSQLAETVEFVWVSRAVAVTCHRSKIRL